MKALLLSLLLFYNFVPLFSQEFELEKQSEIKKGLPPVTTFPLLKNTFDTNRILFAELYKDSTNKFYLLIERKLNDELFYWFIIPLNESNYKTISTSPNKVSENKITFNEEILFEEELYSIKLDLLTNADKCNYTISKVIPKKFPFEITAGLIFELLYSIYDQQITYPYVSELKKGSELDGMVVAFSGKAKLNNNYKLEFRPAIIWQSYLVGIDIGLHLRKRINDYLFIAPGIIFHYTVHFESGGHSGWATRDGWFAFPSITVGIPILKSLPILVSYNYARVNNYYNRFQTFPTQREQKNLNSIIRIGFQFGQWDF